MRKVYESVLERLLSIHYEAEEKRHAPQTLVNNEDSANVWPPWPWPPWEGDDDDDNGPPKHGPKNATELASEVVEFEWKLARASLDLLVRCRKHNFIILTVTQGHFIPRSSVHLQ
jgi:endothelin-converting enzyme